MNFSLSLDKTAKIITAGVTILFAGLIWFQVSIIADDGHRPGFYTSMVLVAVYAICLLFRPAKYSLDKEGITIHRTWKNVFISLNDILEIKRMEKAEISPVFRTSGSGGLFGYFGNFYNFGVGKMKWYASRKDKAIMITTIEGKKIIISPDEPEAFVLTSKEFMES